MTEIYSNATVQLAKATGVPQIEADEVLGKVGRANPMLLVGGFAVDCAIMGMWVALRAEELTAEEIIDRISEALGALYAGLI